MEASAIWARLVSALRGRYVCALEADLSRERERNERLESEIAALRGENRALVNSLLGTAGIPPIEPADSSLRIPTGPATRRRSWSQIAMTRELDATRKAAVRDRAGVSTAKS